jgi:hypothetical protein
MPVRATSRAFRPGRQPSPPKSQVRASRSGATDSASVGMMARWSDPHRLPDPPPDTPASSPSPTGASEPDDRRRRCSGQSSGRWPTTSGSTVPGMDGPYRPAALVVHSRHRLRASSPAQAVLVRHGRRAPDAGRAPAVPRPIQDGTWGPTRCTKDSPVVTSCACWPWQAPVVPRSCHAAAGRAAHRVRGQSPRARVPRPVRLRPLQRPLRRQLPGVRPWST